MVHNLFAWAYEQSCEPHCRQKWSHEVEIPEAVLQVNVEVGQTEEEIYQERNKSVDLEPFEWDEGDLVN